MPGFSAPTLPTFSNDLYGYVQAINYIVRQFAPDIAFGWQTNVWATGTADWLLRANAAPREQGAAIADFINELGFTAATMRQILSYLINSNATASARMP